MTAFASLGKHEQYARLKVWIGRFRFYQASQDRDAVQSDEIQTLAHQVFHRLKWLSKEYEPGYIEAFRQDYATDWATYVAEAQEQLLQAIEAGRRVRELGTHSGRERERVPGDERPLVAGGTITARGTGAMSPPTLAAVASAESQPDYGLSSLLTELKGVLGRINLPSEGLDQFLVAVKGAVDDVGVDHPELLRLVWPYREYITSENGLAALKHQIERLPLETA